MGRAVPELGCSWPCGSVPTHPGFLSKLTSLSLFSLPFKGPGILLCEDDSLYEGTFTRDLTLLGKVRASASHPSHPVKPGLRAEGEGKEWAAGGHPSCLRGVQVLAMLPAVLTEQGDTGLEDLPHAQRAQAGCVHAVLLHSRHPPSLRQLTPG